MMNHSKIIAGTIACFLLCSLYANCVCGDTFYIYNPCCSNNKCSPHSHETNPNISNTEPQKQHDSVKEHSHQEKTTRDAQDIAEKQEEQRTASDTHGVDEPSIDKAARENTLESEWNNENKRKNEDAHRDRNIIDTPIEHPQENEYINEQTLELPESMCPNSENISKNQSGKLCIQTVYDRQDAGSIIIPNRGWFDLQGWKISAVDESIDILLLKYENDLDDIVGIHFQEQRILDRVPFVAMYDKILQKIIAITKWKIQGKKIIAEFVFKKGEFRIPGCTTRKISLRIKPLPISQIPHTGIRIRPQLISYAEGGIKAIGVISELEIQGDQLQASTGINNDGDITNDNNDSAIDVVRASNFTIDWKGIYPFEVTVRKNTPLTILSVIGDFDRDLYIGRLSILVKSVNVNVGSSNPNEILNNDYKIYKSNNPYMKNKTLVTNITITVTNLANATAQQNNELLMIDFTNPEKIPSQQTNKNNNIVYYEIIASLAKSGNCCSSRWIRFRTLNDKTLIKHTDPQNAALLRILHNPSTILPKKNSYGYFTIWSDNADNNPSPRFSDKTFTNGYGVRYSRSDHTVVVN